MNSDDEQLLRGRVYGADPDHPGPLPDRSYVELIGGPLDGLLLDVTGWTPDEMGTGVSQLTDLGHFGPGGRALYDPRPGDRGPLRLVRRQPLTRSPARPGLPKGATSREERPGRGREGRGV
ncbi:hypothetical protein [Streptomyces sp. NRRL WC-3744]|uniref:hypothetical protein n=1 Tax=Streptomyces sp. NRRL WC-3744 TaxID=1463935 RepID=UPI000A5105E8